MTIAGQFGQGMVVIDIKKAIMFTVLPALARDVTSRYGDTVEVESTSTHGTVMLITLPWIA